MRKADNLQPSCAVVTKSGNRNFLEPSGPVQACNGTALPLLSHATVNTATPGLSNLWSPATLASYMYDILLHDTIKYYHYFIFLVKQQPLVGRASSLSWLHDHIQTHHTRWDSSGRVISSAHRPLPDHTQHSHPCSRWDSNPQSQQASGCISTP